MRHTRREFIITTGAAVCLRAAAATGDLDPRVKQVLAITTGIDMHNHVYPANTEPHPHFGGGPPRPQEKPGPELSLAQELKTSGFSAVSASYVLDFAPNDKPGDALANLLHWLTAVDLQLYKGRIRRALTLKDLQAAHHENKPAIIQSVEGALFIEGRLERVEQVYNRGLRHLQLLHMKDDAVSPLGDLNTDPPHLGGLTAFGAQVIKECNRLGILVDMAHASHDAVLGALKAASQPLIISHTNLDTWTGNNPKMAEMMKPRLISKEHAKVVAGAGGIVGVWTHLAATLSEFVQSIKAMVDAIGIDHVGIGTDTDLLASRPGAGTNNAYPNLSNGFFPAVVAEMLRQGFTQDEISKVGGGNYCRVFGQVTSSR